MARKSYSVSSPTERAAIGRADSGREDRGCQLYRNGVLARADHAATCPECYLRLYLIARARERSAFRLRGSDGRIITSDWLL